MGAKKRTVLSEKTRVHGIPSSTLRARYLKKKKKLLKQQLMGDDSSWTKILMNYVSCSVYETRAPVLYPTLKV